MPDGTRFSQGVEDALQPPANVVPGDDSGLMLQKLDSFGKMMARDRLGFVYEMWRNHPACLKKGEWTEPVWGDGTEEKTDNSGGMWKLKIINWGHMWDALGRLDNLSKAAGAIDGSAGAIFTKVQGAWSSKAGEAAAGKVNDLRAASIEYQTQLGELRDHMTGARATTREAIEKLAGFAESGAGGKPMVDAHGELAADDNDRRGDLSRYMDEMDRILQKGTQRWGFDAKEEYVGAGFGQVMQSPESLHAADQVYLTDGDNRWSDQICAELNNVCERYFLTIQNFRKQVRETIQTVEQAWDTLNAAAATMTADPFGKLSLAGPSEPAADDGGGGQDQEGGGGNQDGGGGKPRTGGGGGQDTSASGADTPALPPMPPPADLSSPEQPTTPSAAIPGATDPLAPNPTDPTNPNAPGQSNETVTIRDGDQTIEVSSPDSQGTVTVTVDNGSGTPKTYTLDFGAQTPTVDGGPSTMPYPADSTPQPTPGGGFGPDGTPDLAPGTPVEPGPDGVARIEDGDLSITAYRPDGAPETVVVTVDNGDGSPSTYTLDYSQDAPTQSQTAGAAPQNPAAAGAAPMGSPEPTGSQTPQQAWTAPGESAPTSEGPVSTTTASGVSDLGSVLADALGVESAGGDLAAQVGEATAAAGAEQARMVAGQADGPGGSSGAMGSGMPMMGGMGGGAGGGSGDSERSPSAWRTTGQLFDDDQVADRIGDALGFERR